MIVKKFLAFTTACATALCFNIGLTAFADSGITIPENFSRGFTLESVSDYAVKEGGFAFTSGANIYVYSSENNEGATYYDGTLETYTHSSIVTAVEYGSDGSLYFYDGSSGYLYSEGTAAADDYNFTDYTRYVEDGDYSYSINNSNYIIITDQNDNVNPTTVISDATYSVLKQIDGITYVLKDSTLCTVSDGVINELSFYYDDYETVGEIAVGDTAQALLQADSVQTAAIKEGACLIRVDDDNLSGDYFESLGISFATGGESAQVLYNPDGGNAALISIGEKSYLTLKSNLTIKDFTLSSSSIAYAYFIDGGGIYSLPFCSDSTLLATADSDEIVTILGTAASSAFDYSYYKVEYTSNGTTVTGYALASLLTEYTFSDENGGSGLIEDEPSTENNITTIVLILVIVFLVLIAAGYITYVATAKDDKRTNKK